MSQEIKSRQFWWLSLLLNHSINPTFYFSIRAQKNSRIFFFYNDINYIFTATN